MHACIWHASHKYICSTKGWLCCTKKDIVYTVLFVIIVFRIPITLLSENIYISRSINVICNNCPLIMTLMWRHVVTFRQDDRRLVSCLLFWQDVTDYGKEEDRSADRLLRLCHGWNIYNLYFPDGANYPIGIPHCLHTCMNQQWDVNGQNCYQHEGYLFCVGRLFWDVFIKDIQKSIWIFFFG